MGFISFCKIAELVLQLKINILSRSNLKIGLYLIGAILSILYAIIFSEILNKIDDAPLVIKLIEGIDIVLFLFFLINKTFPFYKSNVNLVSTIYPVNSIVNIVINFLYESINFSHLCVFLFTSALLVLCPLYQIINFLTTWIVIFIAYFIERLLKTIYEKQVGFYFIISIICSFFYFIIIQIFFFLGILEKNIEFFLLLINLFFVFYISAKSVKIATVDRNNPMTSSHILKNYLVDFFLRNPRCKKVYFMGLLFKVSILSLCTFTQKIADKMIFDEIVYWLLISPVWLFTYIYNNLYGFFSELFISVDLHHSVPQKFLSYYINVLILPIIIDFILFILFSFLINQLTLSNIQFYIFILIPLTLNGFYFSLKRVQCIPENFAFSSYKKTTSLLANTFSLLIIITFYFSRHILLVNYLTLFIFLILCAIVYFRIQKNFKIYKYNTLLKLLNNI